MVSRVYLTLPDTLLSYAIGLWFDKIRFRSNPFVVVTSTLINVVVFCLSWPGAVVFLRWQRSWRYYIQLPNTSSLCSAVSGPLTWKMQAREKFGKREDEEKAEEEWQMHLGYQSVSHLHHHPHHHNCYQYVVEPTFFFLFVMSDWWHASVAVWIRFFFWRRTTTWGSRCYVCRKCHSFLMGGENFCFWS